MPPSATVSLLFVCVENSNRSQMAEAFARLRGGQRVQASSAGSRPSGVVNPRAIRAMAELGYDLSTHRSEGLEYWRDREVDVAVLMGCGDACPHVRAARVEEWAIPDPRDLPEAEFRLIRDTIDAHVRALLESLSHLDAGESHVTVD